MSNELTAPTHTEEDAEGNKVVENNSQLITFWMPHHKEVHKIYNILFIHKISHLCMIYIIHIYITHIYKSHFWLQHAVLIVYMRLFANMCNVSTHYCTFNIIHQETHFSTTLFRHKNSALCSDNVFGNESFPALCGQLELVGKVQISSNAHSHPHNWLSFNFPARGRSYFSWNPWEHKPARPLFQ